MGESSPSAPIHKAFDPAVDFVAPVNNRRPALSKAKSAGATLKEITKRRILTDI
jgi:hypothetical protein